VAYTHAKAIDDGAGTAGGDNLTETPRTMYAWDPDLTRGRSSLDVRDSFSVNFSYEVLMGRDLTGVAGALVKGWQFNGIVTLTSGYPLTIRDTRSEQRDRIAVTDGLRADLIPGGNNDPTEGVFAGCSGFSIPAIESKIGTELGGPDMYFDICQFKPSEPGYFGNVGRTTLTTPGLANFDLSFFKSFNVTEGSRVQFRAEFFNLFNRPNFGSPTTSLWSSNGRPSTNAGRISSTRTSARQIQFGLKYIF
jgi:hypothetical protein